MRRRNFLALGSAGVALAGTTKKRPSLAADASCGCEFQPQAGGRGRGGPAVDAFADLQSGLKITGLKVFGVSLTPNSDRPYVFVKIETNQGLIGWGEGTLEGKAGAVIACVNDFRDFLIGADPMQVEHIWQSMYVHSFYRAGPVMGSAISGIDQALWDIRGKALGMPVYKLLGGPYDPRGVRGYYHVDGANRDQLIQIRQTAGELGVTCVRAGIPGYYEWVERRPKIDRAIKSIQTYREALGPDIDIAVDFHAKTSPSVASIIVKEVEPLNLLFIEEPCPPENIQAMRPESDSSRLTAPANSSKWVSSISFRPTSITSVASPVCGKSRLPRMSRGFPWLRIPAKALSAAWRPYMWMRRCRTLSSRKSAGR
jgi:galactonate dehydratase